MTTRPDLERTWRTLNKQPSWSDAALRRFVHFEVRPCEACHGITQTTRCARCGGNHFEPIAEVERAYPASPEACAFFAREAERFTVVEDAARELVGASTQRLRWKTAFERPWGASSVPHAVLDDAQVYLGPLTADALTLVALGVPCACSEADWQRRPPHVSRWVGIDDAHAEVSVDACGTCGATWLEYLYEDHYGNGSRYRGLLDASMAAQVTSATAAALLARLPWYWLGGSYFGGVTTRSSGAVRLH